MSTTTEQLVDVKVGTTEQLVQFLVDTDYSHLSEAAGERAKELVLDFARAALGGGTSPLGKIVLERIKNLGARAEASVIGGKFRTTTAYAAYANAVLDHAPELEAVGTAGPNISQNIAAVLALGEKLKAPGSKVIESIVVGFEIQARVWNGAIAAASARGWVLPFNHVGAVSAACKILDLDVDTARAALGIALGNAGGVNPQENYSHYLQLGVPAFSAVEAAEYAAKGVTANSVMLEAPQGFCDQFAGPGGADFSRMTRDLTEASAIVAILDGDVWLPALTDSSVSSQRYRDARAKVKVIFHPEWSPGLAAAFHIPVTIRLQNGKVYSKEVTKPSEPSKDDIIRQYKELAQPVLKKDEIDRSLDMMLTLEKLEDITQLMNILRAG